MPTYTVKHRATGQSVTFDWQGQSPPTKQDILLEFRKDIKNKLQARGGGGWMEQMPETGYGGVPKWGLQNPSAWGARGAGLEAYNKVIKPGIETTGAVLGSTVSPVAGTALGYGMAKKGSEMLEGFLERAGMPEELQKRKRGVTEEVARSIWDVGSTAVMGKAFEGATRVATHVDDAITNVIRKGLQKGIRPTVVGKSSHPYTENYYRRAEVGVKAIIENKNNIQLVDEFGAPVEGVPKNLYEFTQAIDQTKKYIFKQYDALAKSAGDKGVVVDTAPIVRELRHAAKLIRNRPTPGNDKVAEYAEKLTDQFMRTEKMFVGAQQNIGGGTARPMKMSPVEAQETLRDYNIRNQAYYRNPTPDSAKKDYIDRLVADNLRKRLDDVIENATGQQYRLLKRQYGGLKTLEKEVSHRYNVDVRANPKGFFNVTDVFTGYHAAKAILSMDPTTGAATATGKFIAWRYKIMNQPNYHIKKMFEQADKMMSNPEYTGVQRIPYGAKEPTIKEGVRQIIEKPVKKN